MAKHMTCKDFSSITAYTMHILNSDTPPYTSLMPKKGKHENSSRLDRNEDVDEAEKVGKILIDAMMKYLLDGAEMGEIVEPATYYHA